MNGSLIRSVGRSVRKGEGREKEKKGRATDQKEERAEAVEDEWGGRTLCGEWEGREKGDGEKKGKKRELLVLVLRRRHHSYGLRAAKGGEGRGGIPKGQGDR